MGKGSAAYLDQLDLLKSYAMGGNTIKSSKIEKYILMNTINVYTW